MKVKLGRDKTILYREYTFMDELWRNTPSLIVQPYAFVDGSNGEISSSVNVDCGELYGVVMEKGEGDLDDYLRKKMKKGGLTFSEKISIVESLVSIVAAAHSSGIVLMDFKLANVVRVLSDGDFILKGIDFDCACRKDENITNVASCTPKYVSPAVAKIMVSIFRNIKAEETYSSPKQDIFALALMVFELVSETMSSLWECLGIRVGDDNAILEKAAVLNDEEVENAINSHFGGEKYRDLKSWLLDALKVDPIQRWDAVRLKNDKSLFRRIAATVNVGSLATRNDLKNSIDEMIAALN